MPRRNFIRSLWIALISISVIEFSALLVAFLTSGGRKPGSANDGMLKVLGKVDDFSNGSVTTFRSDRMYLVRMDDGGFLALSLQCTHLGCAVGWNPDAMEFECPCHASSFDMHGDVISPPAPRALDYYPLIVEQGLLKADTRKAVKRKRFNKSQLFYA